MKPPALVNVGETPNDGTGDTILIAAKKISDNLLEIIKLYDPTYIEPIVKEVDDLPPGRFIDTKGWRNEFININHRFEKLFDLLNKFY